ncbi:MAG: hypothetical protein WCO88_16340, partial [Actinomycetota bacterium]
MNANEHDLEQVDRRLSEAFGQKVDVGGGPSMGEVDRRARAYRRRAVGLRVASVVVVVGLIVAAVSLRSGGGDDTAGSPNDAKALAQLEEYCGSTTMPLGTYGSGESVRSMCDVCFGQGLVSGQEVSSTGPGCKPGETVPRRTCEAMRAPSSSPSPPTTTADMPTLVVVEPFLNTAVESRTVDCLSRQGYRFVFAPPGSATRLPRSGVMVPSGGSNAVAREVMNLLGLGELPYDPQLIGDVPGVPLASILAYVVLGDDAAQQMGVESDASPPPTAQAVGDYPAACKGSGSGETTRVPPTTPQRYVVVVNPSEGDIAGFHVNQCLTALGLPSVSGPPASRTRLPKSGVMVPPGGDSAVAQRVMDALGLGALSYDPQLVGDLGSMPSDKILAVVVLGDDAVQLTPRAVHQLLGLSQVPYGAATRTIGNSYTKTNIRLFG